MSRPEAPNVLFLQTDQQRWDALGCLNSEVRTPTLDRLAAGGMHCMQATANCPLCVPSRHSMMLGLYPFQSGIRFNRQIFPTDAHLPVPTLAQRLATAGYQTAGHGKTHWFEANLPGLEPTRRGFEHCGLMSTRNSHSAEAGAELMEDENPRTRDLLEEINSVSTGGETVETHPSARRTGSRQCGRHPQSGLRALPPPRRPSRIAQPLCRQFHPGNPTASGVRSARPRPGALCTLPARADRRFPLKPVKVRSPRRRTPVDDVIARKRREVGVSTNLPSTSNLYEEFYFDRRRRTMTHPSASIPERSA